MSHNPKNPSCETCKVRPRGVFSNLEGEHLSHISEIKSCNLYKKDSVIFHEDNYPMGLFAIFSGKVKVYKTSESGKEQIVRLAKDGDALGYRSLISGEKYEVSATALEDSRLCFIPKNIFLNSLKQSNNLVHRVMELLSHDLKFAENKVADMAQKSVKERLAETLLMLMQFYGIDESTMAINVTLSREDLANLVGTATETLIRSLSEFKQNEIVELSGKKIIIRNLSLLKKIANLFD